MYSYAEIYTKSAQLWEILHAQIFHCRNVHLKVQICFCKSVSVDFETTFAHVCFKPNFFLVMQLVILQINLVLRIISSG